MTTLFSKKLKNRCVIRMALCAAVLISVTGCSVLYSTQLGNVDSEIVLKGQRFEILISEAGFNLDEAAGLATALAKHSAHAKEVEGAGGIIKLFQLGPRTGNPVFSESYSDKVIQLLKAKCPSGHISGLTSIREAAKYPIVSGEIVKLIGYCKKETVKK